MSQEYTNTITSLDNPRIKHLKKLIENKKYRYEQQEFVAEGRNLLDQAKNIKEVYTLTEETPFKNTKTYLITEKILNNITTVENSQGIIALCHMKSAELERQGKYVLLDGLQDPGNMGTIIRTAAGFDYTGVIIGEGCVDPFSPKVVRSTMGAIFTLDIVFLKDLGEIKDHQLIAADGSGEPAQNIKPSPNHILVIGSESQGVNKELLKTAQNIVSIPQTKKIESFNAAVAAGILMYQLRG